MNKKQNITFDFLLLKEPMKDYQLSSQHSTKYRNVLKTQCPLIKTNLEYFPYIPDGVDFH